jgi:hypothetical protein
MIIPAEPLALPILIPKINSASPVLMDANPAQILLNAKNALADSSFSKTNV